MTAAMGAYETTRKTIMLSACLLLTMLAAHGSSFAPSQDPGRQFDFWIGEWSVQNRHLQPDGSWKDGTRTRARITPVCAGAALLEEWAGPFGQSFMNGFSLRAWDPQAESWALVLFWTSNGNGSFGQLSGSFQHGRGEFFAPATGQKRTRYTFSDALPDTVRWDSAVTADGGQTWRADWIMEFSRTAAAADSAQAQLFDVPWNAGQVSPQPAARVLDWMLGDWHGVQVDGDGNRREAKLRCALLNKDCMLLDVLRTRADSGGEWRETMNVRAYETTRAAWVSWRVSSDDTRLQRSLGSIQDEILLFTASAPQPDGSRRVEYLLQSDEDHMQIELARIDADGSQAVLRTTSLARTR